MNELTIDGKTYVSSKRAAEITGYAKDYIGQMCREGRVEARLVGRAWYVLETSLREHRFGSETAVSEPEAPKKPSIVDTWATLRYEAEPSEAKAIPIFEKPSVNAFEMASEALSESHTTVDESDSAQTPLADLQSAWKDWFARRELPAPTEEEQSETREYEALEANATSYQTIEEPADASGTVPESEEIPERDEAPLEPEPVRVPIERIHVKPRVRVNEPIADAVPEGVIIREKRVRRKRKGYRSVYAAAALISIAAMLVALVGSGILDGYLHYLPPAAFDAVAGIHTYEK